MEAGYTQPFTEHLAVGAEARGFDRRVGGAVGGRLRASAPDR